jgi:hypothetical protein
MDKPLIYCDRHGDSPCSVVCAHLRAGVGLEYYATRFPEPDHPEVAQAWCLGCHAVQMEEGGWTDRSLALADLRPVCLACYRETLRRTRG